MKLLINYFIVYMPILTIFILSYVKLNINIVSLCITYVKLLTCQLVNIVIDYWSVIQL